MRRIVVLLASCGLFLSSAVVAHEAPSWDDRTSRYSAWNQLCMEYTPDRSCEGIKPPKVKRVKMEDGLRGYYDGGDTVYLNRKLWGMQKEATTIHEMSHYLDTQLGLNPDMPVRRSDKKKVLGLCRSERRAWDLTDQYWRNKQRPGRAVDGRWVRWYQHCREFAHILYPEKYSSPLPTTGNGFWSRWINVTH